LIIWIRWSLKEPESWQQARSLALTDLSRRMGRLSDLFQGRWLKHTIIGVGLAAIGLATFWGTHIYGKDLYKKAFVHEFEQRYQPEASEENRKEFQAALKRREMIGMLLVTTGGGLGLLSFGPLCERLGRRATFLLFHIGGLLSALFVFQILGEPSARFGLDVPIANFTRAFFLLAGGEISPLMLQIALVVFGFLTLGMHAGYAIYFPELFPTRLRGSGAGFCFNVGRILAAPILFLGGSMQKPGFLGMAKPFTLEETASMLSLLFALGVVLLIFAPETKGQELPE
jgi:hypothetical protein